jgi:hypothetical protein
MCLAGRQTPRAKRTRSRPIYPQAESSLSFCPPWAWRRRMSMATFRLIPASKIKLRRTVSQPVASDFVKGPVKVIRPNAERVNVIHSERTVKSEKSVFSHFSLESRCRPIGSNICQSNRGKN